MNKDNAFYSQFFFAVTLEYMYTLNSDYLDYKDLYLDIHTSVQIESHSI